MGRRVVVTGIGAVTPLGNDVKTTWSALLEGRSGVAPITLFDPSPYSVQIAAEVKGFEPSKLIGVVEPKELRRLDRCVQFSLMTGIEAVRDSGLSISNNNAEDVGIVVGSSIGGIKTLLDSQRILEERGPGRVSPSFIPNIIPDTASGQLAIVLGARGHNLAVSSACATGGHAVGEAFETIRRGDAEVMIAGGTEAVIVPVVLVGFINMRALAKGEDGPEKACRPFDLKRNGFVIGEGAAAVVLESLDHAMGRGVPIYAELVGYGSSADAFHMVHSDDRGEGAILSMRRALQKAGLSPDEVDYLNAHGTGTPLNDKTETKAIKKVFGQHAYRMMISSTKSMTGHMMGAAGVVEAIVCVLAIANGIVPPTINYENPDPECDLDYIPNVARRARVEVALSNAMGLGGHNSTLVFRRFVG